MGAQPPLLPEGDPAWPFSPPPFSTPPRSPSAWRARSSPPSPRVRAGPPVWNGMIDKRPAMIARCADADDVAPAVRFAAERGLPLAVRGGGHNVAGTAVVDDGLVIDLSPMRAVRIDGTGRTVHVQGGATWADVDRVTAPLGLAAPGGVVSGDRRGRPGAQRRRVLAAPARRDDRRQPRLGGDRARRRPPGARERRRAPGPLLGHPRRRRQLRHRHLVRAAPARARPPRSSSSSSPT